MPSPEHEIRTEFFRNRPELAPFLLESVSHCALPEYASARAAPTDCNDLQPKEYRGDTVVALTDGSGNNTFGIVVEVQRGRDERKRFSWPVYLATVRARLECPALLLVVCWAERTARWARTPIDIGHPDWVLRPIVLGPAEIPVVTSAEAARSDPELAALSALAHGSEQEKTLRAFAEALRSIPDDRFAVYHDYVLAEFSTAARTSWEALMAESGSALKTEFARRHYGKGRAEGRAEGFTEGETRAIIIVLEARGIPIDEQARRRITSCTDREVLETWIHRAPTVTTTDELFD
ncbi:hypothetical protein [Nocardiopsis composta]|uniref:Uncharacterized protein n=1 Tax=Nocardiopsis composta TaxID=157465 RepID=A0A7W8QRZ4_9ACTN|nr:hypothetical protein [Nocardiopsis composta]MBB5435530.1 hypothetical protein [Nocardiopsis composta]